MRGMTAGRYEWDAKTLGPDELPRAASEHDGGEEKLLRLCVEERARYRLLHLHDYGFYLGIDRRKGNRRSRPGVNGVERDLRFSRKWQILQLLPLVGLII